MVLYCISGLGGDERVFSFLDLKDVEVRYLNWLKPNMKETMEEYSNRMAQLIDTTREFGIIGVSFGGMVGTEIAKRLNPKFLVLLSSAMTRDELPKLYRIGGKLRLYKLLHPIFLRWGQFVVNWLVRSDQPDKRLIVRQMVQESDPDFLRWSVKIGATWQNKQQVECIRIHGTKDNILPMRNFKADYIVDKGKHLIVMTHPQEVSGFLNEQLKKRLRESKRQ